METRTEIIHNQLTFWAVSRICSKGAQLFDRIQHPFEPMLFANSIAGHAFAVDNAAVSADR